MIVLNPSPTFEAPVKLMLPASTKQEEAVFTFRVLTRKHTISVLILARAIPCGRMRRIFEYMKLCVRIKKLASFVDLFNEIIVGWDGINVPYSKSWLRALLIESPAADMNILNSYLENLGAARRKN